MHFELRLSWYLPKKGQMVLALMGKKVDPSLVSGVFVFDCISDDTIAALLLISIKSHTPSKEDDGRVIFHPNRNYPTDVPADIFVGTTVDEQMCMLRKHVLDDWVSTHPIDDALAVLKETASIDEFLRA